MLSIILTMLCGMAAGFLLRRFRMEFLRHIVTVILWALLLILGVEVGINREIVLALPTLGLEALLITVAALGGCMAGSLILWRHISSGNNTTAPQPSLARNNTATENPSLARNNTISRSEGDSHPLKGSLIIVSFFVLGALAGGFNLIPFDIAGSKLSYYTLLALMCCVGLTIGNDPDTIRKFRSLSPRLLWLPVVTLLGSLTGAFLISLCLSERSITDCMAVASGFGYYSLSSIFITEYRGAELGTVALLSNVAREIITLLAAPLMMRLFGPLAPISSGGATSMDTTLPIITRCSGNQFAVVSLLHGFIMDFSVPFLVTFFCSLNF